MSLRIAKQLDFDNWQMEPIVLNPYHYVDDWYYLVVDENGKCTLYILDRHVMSDIHITLQDSDDVIFKTAVVLSQHLMDSYDENVPVIEMKKWLVSQIKQPQR